MKAWNETCQPPVVRKDCCTSLNDADKENGPRG